MPPRAHDPNAHPNPFSPGAGSRPDPARADKLEQALLLELSEFEAREARRLGLEPEGEHWTDNMLNVSFLKDEKAHVTVLVGGLTVMQDSLMEGALKGLGFKVQYMGLHNNEGYRAGKEYGNKGQCNPTYFTVGHLVNYLLKLRDEQGLSPEYIVKHYLYLTAGACGPCRFGMYLTEYRKALRDAGFEGFRVFAYQQQAGLKQNLQEQAMPIDPRWYWTVGRSVVCGDILNLLGYRIRPYEVEAGATDRALERCRQLVYDALANNTSVLRAMRKCRAELAQVQVDKLRPKAKTAIIGEFWAMTTEGDGNYHLQRFLEQEGGECDIQITTAWMLYTIWEFRYDTRERLMLRGTDKGLRGLHTMDELGFGKLMIGLGFAEQALRRGFALFAQAAGLTDYILPDMDELALVARDFYHPDLRGGEGHMEVAKFILNTLHNKTHLTVSVKPFGCMPSSGVSDGVQSLITARFPGAQFCAVETSGDGAANFYSRIQMFMFKARRSADLELEKALELEGITLEEARAYLKTHPKQASSLYSPAHTAAGSAAALVHELGPLIRLSRTERLRRRVQHGLRTLRTQALALPERLEAVEALVQKAPELTSRARLDAELLWSAARQALAARATEA